MFQMFTILSKTLNFIIFISDLCQEDRSLQDKMSSDEEDLLLCSFAEQIQNELEISKRSQKNDKSHLTEEDEDLPQLDCGIGPSIMHKTAERSYIEEKLAKSLSFQENLNLRINEDKVDNKIQSNNLAPTVRLSDSKQSTSRVKRLRILLNSSSEEELLADNEPTVCVKQKKVNKSLDDDDEVDQDTQSVSDTVDKNKDTFLRHLSNRSSSKPPPAATRIVLDKLPECVESTGCSKMSSKMSVDSDESNQGVQSPMPKENTRLVSSETKKRTTVLIEPSSLAKRPKITLNQPAEDVVEATCKKKLFTTASSSDLNPRKPAAGLSAIDLEKKKYLERMRAMPVAARSNPSSKAIEDLKRLKCKELLGMNLKTKKVVPAGDINLTQVLKLARHENLARQENFARLKAKHSDNDADQSKKPVDTVNYKQPSSRHNNPIGKQNQQENVSAKPYVNPYIKNIPLPLQGFSSLQKDAFEKKLNEFQSLNNKCLATNNRNTTSKKSEEIQVSKPETAASKPTKKPVEASNDLLGDIMRDMDKNQNAALSSFNAKLNKENKAPKQDAFVVETFIFRILKWSFNWLEEQASIPTLPPIVLNDEITPIIELYISYEDYYKAMFPLLLLEIWAEITRAWKELKQDKNAAGKSMPMWLKETEKNTKNPELNNLVCQSGSYFLF